MRVCVLTVLVACGGSPPHEAPKPANVTRATPKARDAIVPAMLADPGVLDRIPQRIRLAKLGVARFRLDEDRTDAPRDREPPTKPLPVLTQTRDRVRVVADLDDARLALWIDAADLATVATMEAQLTDQAGATSQDVGVWVLPGAVLSLRSPGRDNHEVDVKTTAFALHASWLAKRAIGTVYVPAPEPPPPTATLRQYEPLRAAPQDGAAIIADTSATLGLVVLEQRGAWRRVEAERDRVRVRGWVPADAVRDELTGDGTIELGNIYTVSHTTRIDVPAGTCLYDRADGEVIGVNTNARLRLGTRRDGAWQYVYVDTTWGLRTLVVHADGDKLDSCLP